MRKSAAIFAIVVACLMLSGTVLAGSFRSPSKDTTCDGSNCDNSLKLAVRGSLGFGSTCTTDYISYIAWDLTSNVGDSWANAKLTLTTSPTDGVFTTDPGPYTFALVQPNNHTWTPGGSDPGFGSELATSAVVTVTVDGGEKVVFQSDALGTYFSGLKGGTASVGVILKSGCASLGSTVLFHDTGSGAGGVDEPDLIFYPGSGGTAVTLSTFRAADSGPNWPFVAGLVGSLGAALSVSFVLRRRYAVRQANR